MIVEKFVEKYKKEIKQLNRFRSHIPVLKLNVGLSDDTISELQLKINARISQCEISIREYQNKQSYFDNPMTRK